MSARCLREVGQTPLQRALVASGRLDRWELGILLEILGIRYARFVVAELLREYKERDGRRRAA